MNALKTLPKIGKRGPAVRALLPISPKVRLIDMGAARLVCGLTTAELIDLAECHSQLVSLPAFNLNCHTGDRRELRFWVRALNSAPVSALSRSHVTAKIIADCLFTTAGNLADRSCYISTSLLERAWCVSNQTILRLLDTAELTGRRTGRVWEISRFSAAEFLRRRALGVLKVQAATADFAPHYLPNSLPTK